MDLLRAEGVLTSSVRTGAIRMLTHKDVSGADVDAAVAAYARVLAG
jgi:threonine aldolase